MTIRYVGELVLSNGVYAHSLWPNGERIIINVRRGDIGIVVADITDEYPLYIVFMTGQLIPFAGVSLMTYKETVR